MLSLVAKLGQKCHSLQMKPKIYKNIRKIKYSTTEQKHMELCTKNKKNIDDRATLQLLNNKLRIRQNNPICVPKKNNLDRKNNTDSI